jgi:hypothetical protein
LEQQLREQNAVGREALSRIYKRIEDLCTTAQQAMVPRLHEQIRTAAELALATNRSTLLAHTRFSEGSSNLVNSRLNSMAEDAAGAVQEFVEVVTQEYTETFNKELSRYLGVFEELRRQTSSIRSGLLQRKVHRA